VVEHNGGKRVVPTIFFPDGSVLVEPSNQTLSEKIIELGLVKGSE
jgi:mycoredoxin